nr:MAG: OpgC protein [Bacteriophage sp.]
MSNAKKLESIQILRGIAALSVVMFHFRSFLVPEGTDRSLPDALLGWGAIGVDLFFVISGFIMYYVTFNKTAGIKTAISFLINRAIRIIPLYYIILLFAFLTGGAMSTFHYQEKIDNLISAITFTPHLKEYAPLYILESGMYNVRWTLNYELYFYFAFAVCLLFRNKLTLLLVWFLSPVIISSYLTSSITLSTQGYNFNSVALRFITNPIILEFGMGVMAGFIYSKLNKFHIKKSITPPFTAMLLIGVGIYFKQLTSYNLLSGFAFSILVLTFALYNEQLTHKYTKLLVALGNISFPLYLIHNPLMNFIAKKIETPYPNAIHNVSGFLLLISMSVIVSYFIHKYIETKLSSALRHRFNKAWDKEKIEITQAEQAK